MLESSSPDWAVLTIVVGFVFGWRDVSDRLKESAVVRPVGPFRGGVFDVVKPLPWAASADDFCFVEAVDRLGLRIVMTVSY